MTLGSKERDREQSARLASRMDADELAAFLESSRGVISRHWPIGEHAESLRDSKQLETLWRVASDQGWLDLGANALVRAAVELTWEFGRNACPLPVLDAYIACCGFSEDQWLVEAVAAGTICPVVADGRGQPPSVARHADAGAIATHVVWLREDVLSLHLITGIRETPGLAVPAWSELETSEDPVATAPLGAEALDDLRVLTRLGLIARAAGAAEMAGEHARQHACDRIQFGRPIGSFQAVSHRIVDAAVDLRALRAVMDDALGRLERDDDSWQVVAECGVVFGRETVRRAQFSAQHTLAATGYFEEHPAPWLFRRVHADTAKVALYTPSVGELSERLIEGGAHLPPTAVSEEIDALRREVAELVARHSGNPGVSPVRSDPALLEAIGRAGLFTLTWPPELGGRGASVEQQAAVFEEMEYQRAPVTLQILAAMAIGEALRRHGTAEQRAHFLPLITRGELDFYLGYSEPEAGSDLGSLRTRAVRDGDVWIVNGQKSWGTSAQRAKYVWLAARTDPGASTPQEGITMFLAPVPVEGWSLAEHRALSGEISCSTFFDDVRIPDSCRVGEVNQGWEVIRSALIAERVIMGASAAALMRLLDDALAEIRTAPESLAGGRGDARRRTLAEIAARLQAARTLAHEGMQSYAGGKGGALEAPMAKNLTSVLWEDASVAFIDLLGPRAALAESVEDAAVGGAAEFSLRWSVMQVVGGGTVDIQRNLLARALGLPK